MGRSTQTVTTFLIVLLAAQVGNAMPTNLALNKPATANSVYSPNTPDRAVDGDTSTTWIALGHGSVTSPKWLHVDLLGLYDVTRIVLLSRDNPSFSSAYYIDYLLETSVNDSDWSGDLLRGDARWQYGDPPRGNANYAWIQHFLYHLGPNGQAGFVLAKGALTSKTSGEGDIR